MSSDQATPLRGITRKLLDSESALVGWLYRESLHVHGLVNRRYGAVLASPRSALVTFRKDDANSAPTKVWALEDGCKVTPVRQSEYMVRNKNTSTLWALARGHYAKAHLFAFYLKFPPGHASHKDPLKLAFEEEAAAVEWQTAIRKAIGPGAGELPRLSAEPVPETPFAEEPTSPPVHEVEMRTRTKVGSLLELSNDAWGAEASTPYAGGRRSTVSHVNGVAVYTEAGGPDGGAGASMVSAVVSAPPRDVFLALSTLGKRTPISFDWRLVERVDPHTRIVHHRLAPSGGPLAALCAQRESVMQQTWREQEDGTITMLGRSVAHRSMPERRGWGWLTPVRAEVDSAGFTIAPLQPSHAAAGADSCLVTFVFKVDLGGWLSERSWAGWLAGPLVRGLQRAFMQPLLMAVIALRDQVEQARYTVQPFTMGRPPPEPPQEAGEAAAELSQSVSRQLKPMSSMRQISQMRATTQAGGAGVPDTIGEDSEAGEGEVGGFGEALQRMQAAATLDHRFWSCPGSAGFHVRGSSYLQDRRKVPAEEPVFSLASVDLVQLGRRPCHVAPHLPCLQQAKAPFSFVLNLMVPGAQQLALAIVWTAEQAPQVAGSGGGDTPRRTNSFSSRDGGGGDSESEAGGAPFDLLLARFLAGDDSEADARRNATLKLIPSVVKGSWIVKQGVGHTPVILGKKLKTEYHRGGHYMEVDVDIGSSRAANSVVGLVQGAAAGLVIEMGLVLEGHSEEELPECLLGTVRLSNLDLSAFKVLSDGGGGAESSPSSSTKKQQ